VEIGVAGCHVWVRGALVEVVAIQETSLKAQAFERGALHFIRNPPMHKLMEYTDETAVHLMPLTMASPYS